MAAWARKIFSFEPHPELYDQLTTNVALWTESQPRSADSLVARQEAISAKVGIAVLSIPERHSSNHGLASLEANGDRGSHKKVEVSTTTLAQVFEQCGEPVGVLKIDIEGHELAALTGSRGSLQAGAVRDILFEDHHGMTSDVAQLLYRSGYSIFGLNKTPFGPVLLETDAAVKRFLAFSDIAQSINFLATRDPDRARRRMSGRGYKCLLSSRRQSSRIPIS
jgi:FkbM family methyltransferase